MGTPMENNTNNINNINQTLTTYFSKEKEKDLVVSIADNWQVKSSTNIRNIQYYNGIYLGQLVSNSKIYYSYDMKTWQPSSCDANNSSYGIYYVHFKDVWIAATSNTTYQLQYSLDGITWVSPNVTFLSQYLFYQNEDILLIYGYDSTNKPKPYYTEDGKNWYEINITIESTDIDAMGYLYVYNFAYNGETWGLLSYCSLYSSVDGKNWTYECARPDNTIAPVNLTAVHNKWFLTKPRGFYPSPYLYSSNNLFEWSLCTIEGESVSTCENQLGYYNGYYFYNNDYEGVIMYSSDGISWNYYLDSENIPILSFSYLNIDLAIGINSNGVFKLINNVWTKIPYPATWEEGNYFESNIIIYPYLNDLIIYGYDSYNLMPYIYIVNFDNYAISDQGGQILASGNQMGVFNNRLHIYGTNSIYEQKDIQELINNIQ